MSKLAQIQNGHYDLGDPWAKYYESGIISRGDLARNSMDPSAQWIGPLVGRIGTSVLPSLGRFFSGIFRRGRSGPRPPQLPAPPGSPPPRRVGHTIPDILGSIGVGVGVGAIGSRLGRGEGASRRRRGRGITATELRGFNRVSSLLRKVGMVPKGTRRATKRCR